MFIVADLVSLISQTHLNALANIADPDQAALLRVCSACLWKYDISDSTLVDMTGAQLFSCRVLDSRQRGHGLEPHRRHWFCP